MTWMILMTKMIGKLARMLRAQTQPHASSSSTPCDLRPLESQGSEVFTGSGNNRTWLRQEPTQTTWMTCLMVLVVAWTHSLQLIKKNNQRKRNGNRSSLRQPLTTTMTH